MFGFLNKGKGPAAIVADCYTLPAVPGREIRQSLGLVHHIEKGIAGDAPKELPGISTAS